MSNYLEVAWDPSSAVFDLDGAQQIPQDVLFIAFPEFLRKTGKFLLHKALTRPNLLWKKTHSAFVS